MNTSGFTELEHTADWALRVWAGSLEDLLAQAARGMYSLMEVKLADGPRIQRRLVLEGSDLESLLVSFLSELLYVGEEERLAFDRYELHLSPGRLDAWLEGAEFTEQRKEIKAVTYHKLEVRQTQTGWEVTIVFDV